MILVKHLHDHCVQRLHRLAATGLPENRGEEREEGRHIAAALKEFMPRVGEEFEYPEGAQLARSGESARDGGGIAGIALY